MDEAQARQVVDACAANRDACGPKPLTVPEAIADALWVRKTSDGFITLRQHDRAAPRAIKEWAGLAEMHGAGKDKIESARTKAQRWDMQPHDTTRWPT